jgi:hypothetical protein
VIDHVFAWTCAVWIARHFGRELPFGGELDEPQKLASAGCTGVPYLLVLRTMK